jgi:hypothetical protein
LNAVKKERKHERRVINIELYILHPKRMWAYFCSFHSNSESIRIQVFEGSLNLSLRLCSIMPVYHAQIIHGSIFSKESSHGFWAWEKHIWISVSQIPIH